MFTGSGNAFGAVVSNLRLVVEGVFDIFAYQKAQEHLKDQEMTETPILTNPIYPNTGGGSGSGSDAGPSGSGGWNPGGGTGGGHYPGHCREIMNDLLYRSL